MKIGYPCINRTLECSSSGTFRLKSFTEERFRETVGGNIACLEKILAFNLEHNLLFFRISSALIPFASHPVCAVPWQNLFAAEFRALGRTIRRSGMRISMHPDQFTLINARDPGILERSIAELQYHADVLDSLELDLTAKIQIHVGGVYDDKAASMRRFMEEYRRLPAAIRRRLVIENDDRSYTAADCRMISSETGIPVLFDVFHHEVNSTGVSAEKELSSCAATWHPRDGIPMIDYSLQKEGGRRGSHADHIDAERFAAFLSASALQDFDIMLEIKDKEHSALTAASIASADPRFRGA